MFTVCEHPRGWVVMDESGEIVKDGRYDPDLFWIACQKAGELARIWRLWTGGAA